MTRTASTERQTNHYQKTCFSADIARGMTAASHASPSSAADQSWPDRPNDRIVPSTMYNTHRLRTYCQFYNNLQFVHRYSQLERKRALSTRIDTGFRKRCTCKTTSVFDRGHLPQAVRSRTDLDLGTGRSAYSCLQHSPLRNAMLAAFRDFAQTMHLQIALLRLHLILCDKPSFSFNYGSDSSTPVFRATRMHGYT
jgi:hypothetical protein